MKNLRNTQKELRALKKEANQAVREIRSDYSTQKTMVGKGIVSAVAAGLLGRRTVGSFNSIKRDSLRNARDDAIAPFEELKNVIDRTIHQIDMQKHKLESSDLYKNKPAPKKPKLDQKTAPPRSSVLKAKKKRYFVNLKGEIKGPLTVEQIEVLLATEVADRNTLACVEGEIDWHPLRHFFEVPE